MEVFFRHMALQFNLHQIIHFMKHEFIDICQMQVQLLPRRLTDVCLIQIQGSTQCLIDLTPASPVRDIVTLQGSEDSALLLQLGAPRGGNQFIGLDYLALFM